MYIVERKQVRMYDDMSVSTSSAIAKTADSLDEAKAYVEREGAILEGYGYELTDMPRNCYRKKNGEFCMIYEGFHISRIALPA
jgi:hypothetical protein